MGHSGKHFIAIIGGSVAGSEAAFILAEKGFRVVVFDQKKLPYGKIEDGLPKWHIGLRNKEEQKINERMSHPNIRFVPEVRLGRDLTLDALATDWGFSVVIIAIGAWLDRKLPIDGIDALRNNGLIYQNDLLFWYNHRHEPDYKGSEYNLPDGTCVIGGGLASIDVVKMVMIEIVQKAIKVQKGVDIDLFTFEKKGVANILEANNTSLKDLGLKGCTLFYRKRVQDMPLYPRKGDSPTDIEKAQRVTEKLLLNYQSKYLFNFEERCIPKEFQQKDGKLTEITFQRVNLKDNQSDDICKFKTNLVISSIGSLPEKLPSIPYKGGYLKTYGEFGHKIEGFDNVFAIGNVVTGKGNILDSKKHGRKVTGKIIEGYFNDLKLHDPMEDNYDDYFRKIESSVGMSLGKIVAELESCKVLPDAGIQQILDKTKALQEKAGFNGNYQQWVDKWNPIRLEDMP